jgi:hypothetical protein
MSSSRKIILGVGGYLGHAASAGYAPFDVWLQPTTHQARNVLFLPKA